MTAGRNSSAHSGGDPGYRGRFAPSPTGPLHFGSLIAATASYLQALVHDGEWLLRIEDIDPPRESPGGAEQLIDALTTHGFSWCGPVRYQHARLNDYQAVVERLLGDGAAYRCACTRDEIRRAAKLSGPTGPIYPGTCRDRNLTDNDVTPSSIRLRTTNAVITFDDMLQGPVRCHIADTIGDFIIRRRDGLIAYNLAVVIDDARQRITEVVRGCDLLDMTPAQIALQRALGLPTPRYMHIPVATHKDGQKLSKQSGAEAVDLSRPGKNLIAALRFLRQEPPPTLATASLSEIWYWAGSHWHPENLGARRHAVAITE